MGSKVALREILTVEKRPIKPIAGTTYELYSLPAFDNNKTPECVDGATIKSGKIEVCPDTILLNKLNTKYRRIWPIEAVEQNSIASTEFVPLRPHGVDYWFIYYWLISPRTTQLLVSLRAGTSSSHQRSDINAFLQTEIELPPEQTQKKIGSVLHSLDKKIELNARTNGCLEETCVALAHNSGVKADAVLGDVCSLVTEKCPASEAEIATYVSSENLLPNYGDKQEASSLPTEGMVTVFRRGDILISNIRPYFKKIWYASTGGTCSTDVIVLRAKDHTASPYFYSCLRQDSFFSYVMAGAKGTKMPRGDKQWIMKFPIGSACPKAELKAMTNALAKVSTNNQESRSLVSLRDALLPKLMSGEIDVSEVDITQPNSRLCEC